MNAQEILDKAVNYTFNDYLYNLNRNTEPDSCEKVSQIYSSMILTNIIKNKTKSFEAFLNDTELLEDMKSLSKNDIKRELLKNMTNNAILMKMNMDDKIKTKETRIRPGMDADDYSLIVYNSMLSYGIQRGYSMLQKYSILYGACELYVRNRINNRGAYFDDIALSNEEGIAINSAIDEYFENKKQTQAKAKTLIKK